MAIEDLGPSLRQNLELNQIIADRVKLFEKLETAMGKQSKIVQDLAGSMSDATKTVKDVASSQNDLMDAAEKAATAQEKLNTKISDATKESEEYEKRLEKISNLAGMFGDALEGAASSTVGLIKAGGNLIGMFFNVGAAVVSLPFKLWDAFVDKSANMPYNPAFAQMREDVREMFGSLKSGAGKEVMDGYYQLRSEMGAMAKETGLSMQRIFGYGVDGKAAMLGFIKDMSQGLGSQLIPIMEQIGDDIGEVTYAIKGMGLSAEESGVAMKFFYNSGQNASKMLQDMGKTAAMMAKQTGFNIKTMSKAMVETTTAFPQFAKQGIKAMAEVAHYTHNLGIEVKDLQAVFDKFDSFEGAAESASQLSQAFGVQIDAMKMVKEQSPTRKLEELRNAFKAAGKDINSMTSAERKLAEQTVGLSGAAFEAALGEGSKKKSLNESEKAAKAATHAAKDQTKAMRELAESIKRIIPPQAEKFKGFFDAFTKGFSEGMFYSKNMREMMVNLQRVFRDAYWFGFKFARLFFDNFPGITDLARGFTKVFDPAKFRAFFNETIEGFKTFFSDLERDPKAGFQKFIDRIKTSFERYFGGSGTDSALAQIRTGFLKILRVMGVIGGEIVGRLIASITEGIRNLIDLIAHPEKVTNVAGAATSFMGEVFNPIVQAIKENGPALVSALKDLWNAAWPKVQPVVEEVGWTLAKFFAIKFAAGFALTLAAEMAKKKLLEMIMGGGTGSASIMSGAKNLAGTVLSSFKNVFGGKTVDGLSLNMMQNIGSSFKNASLLGKAGMIGVGITVAKGMYDGLMAGINSNKEDEAAFAEGVQTVGASILSTFSMGMFSPEQIKSAGEAVGNAFMKYNPVSMFVNVVTGGWLNKKLDDATKKYKEMGEQIANSQKISADGIKLAMQEGMETTRSLYEKALKEGKTDDAVSYAAQLAAAEQGLQWGTPEFAKERDRQKVILQEKVKKDLATVAEKKADEAKNAIKTLADKEEAEKFARIEKARTLVEQVKDVGELNTQLDNALVGLDKAMEKGQFEKKIKDFRDRITSIYPMIESIAKQIAEARKSAAIQLETNKADPIAVLGEAMQGASKLADGMIKLQAIPEGAESKIVNFIGGLTKAAASIDITNLASVARGLDGIAQDIVTAEGNLSKAIADVKVIKEFKAGKLEVTHNIPNVKMEVVVNLSTEQLAKSIINVDVSKDTKIQKRITVDTRGEDRSIG